MSTSTPSSNLRVNPSPFSSTTRVGGRSRVRATPPPSLTLPGFEDVHLVGEGGMGCVYRARDTALKRTVALKMIKTDTLSPDRLARFRTEAEALARLQHPHIVQVFAWEERASQPLLVLEFVAGGTLSDVLDRGPLSPREAAKLVAILARAVQAAHAAGVVHRDLKPGNVLMAPPLAGNSGTVCGGFPKVTDFGLAQLTDDGRGTADGMILGTPAYMAPEQATGNADAIGPQADVWALGVVLFQSLLGRLPFPNTSPEEVVTRLMLGQRPSLTELRKTVAEELADVCAACLSVRPDDRPSPGDLAERLERYLDGQPDSSQTLTLKADPRPRHRGKLAVALAALLAIVGGGLAGVFTGHFRSRADESLPPLTAPAEPLAVTELRVLHEPSEGLLGVHDAPVFPNERVKVTAELSDAAYGFVLALTPDCGEQLLWPADPTRPPEPRRQFQSLTAEDGWVRVRADERGGMLAIVVVASRQPLPAFADWQRRRGPLDWHWMPPSRTLVIDDGAKLYPIRPTGERSGPPPGPLLERMTAFRESVRAAPAVETHRLLVFPVQD